MTTLMAVLGMVPVEVQNDQKTDPRDWTWKPQVQDWDRLTEAVKASNNTSKNTFSSQLDHGEGK